MNRFKLGLLAEGEYLRGDEGTGLPEHELAYPGSAQTAAPTADLAFEYSISLPAHFESGYAYPLLIWLHSSGSDQNQLLDIMPAISDRNFVGASVRGTGQTPCGFGWEQTQDSIELAINQVGELINWLESRIRINRDRVFVAGAGSGGTMAFRLAFQSPDLFCGAGSFNGSLPSRRTPLANLKNCRNIPVFWMHSRNSGLLTESELCQQLRLLHIGGFDVTLRQYPGDDELSEMPFPDFHRWMMEQIALLPDSGIVL